MGRDPEGGRGLFVLTQTHRERMSRLLKKNLGFHQRADDDQKAHLQEHDHAAMKASPRSP